MDYKHLRDALRHYAASKAAVDRMGLGERDSRRLADAMRQFSKVQASVDKVSESDREQLVRAIRDLAAAAPHIASPESQNSLARMLALNEETQSRLDTFAPPTITERPPLLMRNPEWVDSARERQRQRHADAVMTEQLRAMRDLLEQQAERDIENAAREARSERREVAIYRVAMVSAAATVIAGIVAVLALVL